MESKEGLQTIGIKVHIFLSSSVVQNVLSTSPGAEESPSSSSKTRGALGGEKKSGLKDRNGLSLGSKDSLALMRGPVCKEHRHLA